LGWGLQEGAGLPRTGCPGHGVGLGETCCSHVALEADLLISWMSLRRDAAGGLSLAHKCAWLAWGGIRSKRSGAEATALGTRSYLVSVGGRRAGEP
jgi:hypothetical protein